MNCSDNDFCVRPARLDELDSIMPLYDSSRAYMRAKGNTVQWVNGYPSRKLIEADIKAGNLHVIALKGKPRAVFTLIAGADPTYALIEGEWPDNEPYSTMHRLASDGTVRGVFGMALRYSMNLCSNLRADTHEANLTMRRILEENGFRYCGIIYVADGTPRLAFCRKFTSRK